ncbi:uncharacterized protein V1516DRAFT_628900 [Lipomyces oligophaga]|uniref:uncharacterized protein n=1 Tax=Lipomyces oligophaga TaxID=45792 RepID=UPI0034CF6EC3
MNRQHGGHKNVITRAESVGAPSVATTFGICRDDELAPQSIGCIHVKQLLSSSSKDIALRSYRQAVRVALELQHKDTDLSAFQVRRCRKCSEMLTTTFFCLQCPFVGCRKNRHAEAHHKETGHIFGVDSRSGNLYCFYCRDYVFNYMIEHIKSECMDNSFASKLRKRPQTSDQTDDKQLLEKRSRIPPCPAQSGLRGFLNMGATCFMSVILQSLVHNPIVRNDFLSGGHNSKQCERENCLNCCLDDIFTEFFASPSTTGFGPAQLLTTAWRTQRSLAGYSEQDAHEFLQFILDQLHGTSTNIARIDSNVCSCIVHRTFRGHLQSNITCPNCSNVTETVDPFMDLSLEIKDRKDPSNSKMPSLQKCLERFTSPEKLETKYMCSFCSTRQEVTKQLKIKQLPVVLTIQLKRFEHSLKSNKIDGHIPFSMEIDMTPFTTRPSSKRRYLYDLFGVVCHTGKINTGHYTCSMKTRDGQWFYFDDAMVTVSNEKEVLASRAYLLFYIVRTIH